MEGCARNSSSPPHVYDGFIGHSERRYFSISDYSVVCNMSLSKSKENLYYSRIYIDVS